MAEANGDSTPNRRTVTLRVDEIHNLADRLLNRALSKVSAETAESQRDLKTASRALRALLRHFSSSDTIIIDGNGA
jgi:hypothetical protein